MISRCVSVWSAICGLRRARPGDPPTATPSSVHESASTECAPSVARNSTPIKSGAPGIALIYGFNEHRTLDNRPDGLIGFALDDLNRALGINVSESPWHLLEIIGAGIQVNECVTRFFSDSTGINPTTSEELLASWADFIKENVDCMRISSILDRKRRKYGAETDYPIAKNNFNNSWPIHDTEYIRGILSIFVKEGDENGFNNVAYMSGFSKNMIENILNITILRKLSKLGMQWAERESIPLIFEINFEHESAMTSDLSQYRPITFSEYRFHIKNQFDNIKIVPNERTNW